MVSFVLFFVIVAILLGVLGWVTRRPKNNAISGLQALSLERAGQHHSVYFPAIRRALCKKDLDFIETRGSARLARRARKDRRRVALAYLAGVREDFQRLMHVAKVIAVLSPEVVAAHEWERFRLGMQFSVGYQMTRTMLYFNFLGLPQLTQLSTLVSGFATQMDLAIKELGERAAQAAELTQQA